MSIPSHITLKKSEILHIYRGSRCRSPLEPLATKVAQSVALKKEIGMKNQDRKIDIFHLSGLLRVEKSIIAYITDWITSVHATPVT